MNKIEGIKKVTVTLDGESVRLLNDLARHSFRTVSAQVRFMVMEEYNRQVGAVNSIAPVKITRSNPAQVAINGNPAVSTAERIDAILKR